MHGTLKSIVITGFGFGFLSLSKAVELRGDLEPFVEDGVSTGRLFYHSIALAILLIGLGCFIYALKSIFSPKTQAPIAPSPQPLEDISAPDDDGFDPDAIISRYLESKKTNDDNQRRRQGFGRKGL
jgi:hypothetical protein